MSYAQAYARALNDPRRVLGRGGRGAALGAALGPGARRFAPALLPVVHGRPAQHLLQRSRSPPRRARPPAGPDPRQPGHRQHQHADLRRAEGRGGALRRRAAQVRRRPGRPRDHLHADGARGGDRDARLRPARRDPLGGVRRLRRARARDPDRRREAEADPLGVLRHRGGPGGRRTSRCSTRRSRRRRTSPSAASSCSARSARRTCRRAAIWCGRTWCRRQRLRTACRSMRPIRSTSSTPRAPRASPRAWCATTAAMPWRCAGPCRTSTTSTRARFFGRPRTSAGWSATATSATRRC